MRTWISTLLLLGVVLAAAAAPAAEGAGKPLTNSGLRNRVAVYKRDPAAAQRKYGPIGTWNTQEVTNMKYLFQDDDNFNGDIGAWDTSSVTNMYGMFYSKDARGGRFNQDIGAWDTSSVTNMSLMFAGAELFNRDIGGWDVSKVTHFSYTFSSASTFNQDIGGWDVSSARDMFMMFASAKAFNQDIGGWDIDTSDDMSWMFNHAESFTYCLPWAPENYQEIEMFVGSQVDTSACEDSRPPCSGIIHKKQCTKQFGGAGCRWLRKAGVCADDDRKPSSEICKKYDIQSECESIVGDVCKWNPEKQKCKSNCKKKKVGRSLRGEGNLPPIISC